METRITRPELGFITSQKFENFYDANDFYNSRKDFDERQVLRGSMRHLPELIQIAEMFFDQNVHNPDSFAFQMVSKVLNEIKES